MNNKRWTCLVIFAILFAPSCLNSSLSYKMRVMMENKVIMPQNILTVWHNNEPCYGIRVEHPLLVIHMDSTDCSTCLLPKLSRFSNLYIESKSTKQFELVVIVSPTRKEADHINHHIKLKHFIFPVYVDIENRFDALNPSIPPDHRFRCFLTEYSGKPIFIGDPTTSERMMALFRKHLDALMRL